MKKVINTFRNNKYYKLISGFLFACMAVPFFVWGIVIILQGKGTYLEIVIPFIGILTCLIFGFHAMFRKEKIAEATF